MYYDGRKIISYNDIEKEYFFIKEIYKKEDRIMKKRLGLFLATLMVLSAIPTTAFAWENPLKKYNLYDDVMSAPQDNAATERERATEEFYNNSLAKKYSKGPSPQSKKYDNISSYDLDNLPSSEPTKTRNETLRESSRDVFSDQESTPAWLEGPSFYPNPSFDSIIEKYRRSDFAGCLQECISYVRKNPYDTLGYYYLAMAYTKCSDKDNAVRAYEKVIELNDNPMIVKYATNGRNCVLGEGDAPCYQNVNEPEYLRPYANLAELDLQPIDPQVLIDRNLARLREKLNPLEIINPNEGQNEGDENKEKVTLPFGKQDEDLDKFINAPYGNGLSPELNKQYKQLQLKKLQETINKTEESTSEDKKNRNIIDIKKFDNQKSDSETVKLAYDPSAIDMDSIMKDPEYIKQRQEFDELNMLLGNEKSKDSSDIMDLLPYMTEGDKKLSPEVIQSMMMKSMMGDITL